MAQAQSGNTVHVHYTGTLEDGTVFDSSSGGAPLRFTLGAGEVITGFEEAVLGLKAGQSVSTVIVPEDGYGARLDELVVEIPRAQMAADVHPEVGQHLHLGLDDGRQIPVVVTHITDEAVTLDANHPLAGKTLRFDIELVDFA